ncbi:MAG: hypothetical protein M0C28_13375 [Candidatus Moduliflexus flocculans]|nr:hypothetical protein [Candidatus Moduliflexus flocculans]
MDHHDLLVSAEQAGVRLDQFLVGELPRPFALADPAPHQGRPRPGRRRARRRRTSVVRRRRTRSPSTFPTPAPATPQPETSAARRPLRGRRHHRRQQAGGHGGAPGAGARRQDTLVNALLHHVDDLSGVGGELRPGIVHRLDRGTSGVHGGRQARRARTAS